MKRITAIFVILTVVLLTTAGCGAIPGGPKEQAEKPPTSIITTNPTALKIERTVRFSGTLKGNREVMVYPTMPGKLIGYSRSEGGFVSKGGTVARIDRDIPGVEYEPVPVQAPISGRFFSMGMSSGEMVVPQMPIGYISETGRLKLEFSIPEKYINSVKQGSRAKFYVPSLDYTTTATLTKVPRFIDARAGGAQAEASVSNSSGKMTPGMHAEVNVVVASKKANLAIPIDCVLGLEQRFVYVVTDQTTEEIEKDDEKVTINVGIAQKRDVQVGLEDGSNIEIISGLEPSDEVIYVGQRIVEEGGKVRITDTYSPAEK